MILAGQNQRRYRGCRAGQACGEVCSSLSHPRQIPMCGHGFGWRACHRVARLSGKPQERGPRRLEIATGARKIPAPLTEPESKPH
jgi:hypothetical protein